jgi:hypothetical protein
MTIIHLALAADGLVLAHFARSADAAAFCAAKSLTHVPYNTANRENLPAPVVGSVYRA